MAAQMQNDPQNQQAGGKPATKKSPLKFIVIGVLLLLAAAAALYFTGALNRFFPGSQPESAVETPPAFSVPMEEFQVNLADDGARRFLRMSIHLAFDDGALSAEIEKRAPEIRSNIIAVLRSKTVADLEGPEGMELLRQAILTQLNQILQEGQIKTVYYTDFILQ